MPLQAPTLDDRKFDTILSEARSLIPRYAPEWTNYNASDPGITLLELYAWLTEMLLYRLNQVPERNYIKFLQLLGIELKPSQPARAELTFTLARDDLEYVTVSKGTQVAAASGGEGGAPLLFETDAALICVGAKLQAIQSFNGFGHSVETPKNGVAGQWFYPFGPLAKTESALMLGFASPIAFTSQQVNLAFELFTEGLTPEGSHCDVDLGVMPVPATLVWEYFDGKLWQLLSLDKDETRAFTRSGHIYFRGPGALAKKTALGDVKDALYWVRCRLAAGQYERSPRLTSVLTNTTRATQAITIRDEIVGGSEGRPNQTLALANAPIVVRDQPEIVKNDDGTRTTVTSMRLEIDEGLGFRVWQEVEDFHASKPDDSHYVLNRTTGEIRFGDGAHGRIPVANPANPNANIVAREYRTGGGKAGNVGANVINGLQTFIAGVSGVTNLQPALGGAGEETVTEAKLRAPLELKSKDRAVTAEDFEFLASETPGVRIRRAKALPLTHPQLPGVDIPGVVTVIVVPDSDAPNPMPSPATVSIVCAHLNAHRLLTSEVFVVAPTYRLVKIEADIVARPEADLAEVKNMLEDNLTNYFHPLLGGDKSTGWEFGGAIYYSEVVRVVLQTPGVARIKDSQFFIWLEEEKQDFCKDVPLERGELTYSNGHQIRMSYG